MLDSEGYKMSTVTTAEEINRKHKGNSFPLEKAHFLKRALFLFLPELKSSNM